MHCSWSILEFLYDIPRFDVTGRRCQVAIVNANNNGSRTFRFRDTYLAPPLAAMPTLSELTETLERLEGLGYGKPMRSLFMQDPDYVQLNHGSVRTSCLAFLSAMPRWR